MSDSAVIAKSNIRNDCTVVSQSDTCSVLTSVSDHGLWGDIVLEEAEKDDVHSDSHDMMIPLSVEEVYTGLKFGVSMKEESLENCQISSHTVGPEERNNSQERTPAALNISH